MPTPEARKERHKLTTVIWALIAAGLLYVSGSIFVVKYLVDQNQHLVDKNLEFCQQRQLARSTIRYFFIKQAGAEWTQADQLALDEGLSEFVPC